ncbi:hypothetical protein JCM10207_006415 [Rhodosporidiobolus poonsookiae]
MQYRLPDELLLRIFSDLCTEMVVLTSANFRASSADAAKRTRQEIDALGETLRGLMPLVALERALPIVVWMMHTNENAFAEDRRRRDDEYFARTRAELDQHWAGVVANTQASYPNNPAGAAAALAAIQPEQDRLIAEHERKAAVAAAERMMEDWERRQQQEQMNELLRKLKEQQVERARRGWERSLLVFLHVGPVSLSPFSC